MSANVKPKSSPVGTGPRNRTDSRDVQPAKAPSVREATIGGTTTDLTFVLFLQTPCSASTKYAFVTASLPTTCTMGMSDGITRFSGHVPEKPVRTRPSLPPA